MYVCASPSHTYPTADELPDELRRGAVDALDVDPVRFGIRTVETVFAAARYAWPVAADRFVMPDEFTDSLERFYTAISGKVCPASVLVELQGAIIAGNVVYCEDGSERRTLYETARVNDRHAIERASEAELAAADRQIYADRGWHCFYLGSAGSSNYGHWLVDDLPRLKAAASLMHNGGKPLRIVIPGFGSAVDQVRIDSIRKLLHAPVHVDLMHPRQAHYFPQVFYATPVSDHPVAKSPLAIDYAAREVLAGIYAGGCVARDGQETKIFVRRARGESRALRNEGELLPRLVERGFVPIDTHAMTFAEQVHVFAQATHVVGIMGAAMTNTLFCRPHTRLLYLAPRGWIEPFYLDLAVVRGHGYRILYGEPHEIEAAPFASSFSVEVEHVLDALA